MGKRNSTHFGGEAFDAETLPSGKRFAFWDDATAYRKVYHVDQKHPAASDKNPGTAKAPFATINAAAERLQPGEKAIIHAGIYRECVRPARGGTGPKAMIAYEAAPGERVVVRGSAVWTPDACPSAGYAVPRFVEGANPAFNPAELDSYRLSPEQLALPPLDVPIWMADLPDVFADNYNPFLIRNAYSEMSTVGDVNRKDFFRRMLMRRGMVFMDGKPLTQVLFFRELAVRDGAFWCEEPGRRLHVRLPGDDDPSKHLIEVTAREQVFAPYGLGLGYLRISGLVFEHAADGVPVPQRAAVSAMRGHHWIIERCEVAWANAIGIDLGMQTWEATVSDPSGGHIVRGNRIHHTGVSGIAGVLGVHHTLIECNTIEHIGGTNLEGCIESSGIELHAAEHCLIRGNMLRHMPTTGGIWMDCSNVNNRITRNVFADMLGTAVIFEITYERNLVDHNICWDTGDFGIWNKGEGAIIGGLVDGASTESLIVAHNFFHSRGPAGVSFTLDQHRRQHQGRTPLCSANGSYNNIFYRCPKRVIIGRLEKNCSDGNLYDLADDTCSLDIVFPAPACQQNLAGWQKYFGLDLHSTQARLTAEFDIQTGALKWKADGPLPKTQPVPGLPASAQRRTPGPVEFRLPTCPP